MKPEKLTMTAFGPYAGQAEIDFTRFQGIFLITGDTGSGKTTVFDGLCYALYERASGFERTGGHMRSHFAPDDVKTQVVLTFTHKGLTYTVSRSPAYDRPKLKGRGSLLQPAAASLTAPDRVISGSKGVNAYIEELLGLDYSQFKQLSMIAQGEFRELLQADTDERAKILRRVFDTQLYEKAQAALQTLSNQKLALLTQLDARVQLHGESLVLPAPGDQATQGATAYELLELARHAAARDGELCAALDAEAEALAAAVQDLGVQKALADSAALARLQLERALAAQAALKAKADWAKELERAVSRARQAQGLMGHESLLAAREQGLAQQTAQLAAVRDKAEKARKSLEQTQARYDRLEDEQEYRRVADSLSFKLGGVPGIAGRDCAVELGACRSRLAALPPPDPAAPSGLQAAQAHWEKLEGAKDLLAKVEAGQARLLAQQALCKDREESYRRAWEQFTRADGLFLAAQAGLLAQGLAPGAPCPVCGSTAHPQKAVPAQNAPTQSRLEELKAAALAARESYAAATGAARELTLALAALAEEGAKALEKLNLAAPTQLGQALEQARLDLEGAQSRLKASQKAQADRQELEAALCRLEGEMCAYCHNKYVQCAALRKAQAAQLERCALEKQGAEQSVTDGEKALAQGRTALAEARRALDQAVAAQDMTMDQYLAHKAAAPGLARWEAQLAEYQRELAASAEGVRVLQGAQSTQPGHPEQLAAALSAARARLESAAANAGQVRQRLSANRRAAAALEKLAAERGELVKQFEELKQLADAAGGRLAGRLKISFENYVQGWYFQEVLSRANERLAPMTQGRYTLTASQTQKVSSRSALDVWVEDAFTGKARPASTLSGGEAFEASLALALGLSDVIGEYSGGIRSDALFVDEGFGALDSSSLENALTLLESLTCGRRMVGVISHVDQLKSRIDDQITVTASPSGSTLAVRTQG